MGALAGGERTESGLHPWQGKSKEYVPTVNGIHHVVNDKKGKKKKSAARDQLSCFLRYSKAMDSALVGKSTRAPSAAASQYAAARAAFVPPPPPPPVRRLSATPEPEGGLGGVGGQGGARRAWLRVGATSTVVERLLLDVPSLATRCVLHPRDVRAFLDASHESAATASVRSRGATSVLLNVEDIHLVVTKFEVLAPETAASSAALLATVAAHTAAHAAGAPHEHSRAGASLNGGSAVWLVVDGKGAVSTLLFATTAAAAARFRLSDLELRMLLGDEPVFIDEAGSKVRGC